MLPTRCVICGDPPLFTSELAPLERWGAILNCAAMCARHWSNFAQGIANSHGESLLREEEMEGGMGFTIEEAGDEEETKAGR